MIIQKVRDLITANGLVAAGDTLVVGLSGGADSVALFRVMTELSAEMEFSVAAVHVHHGIRGDEASRDESFAKELAKKHAVPYFSFFEDVPEIAKKLSFSEEEAGRYIRYKRFAEVAEKLGGKVMVAHHNDDQAETIFYQQLRGCSLDGLCGMKVRDLYYAKIGESRVETELIRPLLYCTREEILEYLHMINQDYVTDSTNLESDYARNQIRNEIFPALSKINSQFKEHLINLADDVCQANVILEEMADELYEDAERDGELLVSPLLAAKEIVAKKVLLRFVEGFCGARKDITRAHVDNIYKLLDKKVGKKANLPYDIIVEKSYETIKIYGSNDSIDGHDAKELADVTITEFPYESDMVIPSDGDIIWFDKDKLPGEIEFRFPEEGDYLYINADGRKKELRRLFIDEKVPKDLRHLVPIIAVGKRAIWVKGVRHDEALRIDENTKTILEIKNNGLQN